MDRALKSRIAIWIILMVMVFVAGVLAGYGMRTPITAFLDLLDGEAVGARQELAKFENSIRRGASAPDPCQIQTP